MAKAKAKARAKPASKSAPKSSGSLKVSLHLVRRDKAADTAQAPTMARNASSSSSTSFMKTSAQMEREVRTLLQVCKRSDDRAPAVAETRRQNEVSFEFLRPDLIRDADRRRPDDPDYDARTLFISEKELNKLSPFEQQVRPCFLPCETALR